MAAAPALDRGVLRARALRLLARREHSRLELRRKLGSGEIEPDLIEAVLDELQQEGWLSEQRLAEQLVGQARQRYGARRVLQRLREKGVGGEVLDQAADTLRAQDLDSARALWRKRFGQPAKTLQEKAKQARFLAGRGFSPAVITRVLGRPVEDPADGDRPDDDRFDGDRSDGGRFDDP